MRKGIYGAEDIQEKSENKLLLSLVCPIKVRSSMYLLDIYHVSINGHDGGRGKILCKKRLKVDLPIFSFQMLHRKRQYSFFSGEGKVGKVKQIFKGAKSYDAFCEEVSLKKVM